MGKKKKHDHEHVVMVEEGFQPSGCMLCHMTAQMWLQAKLDPKELVHCLSCMMANIVSHSAPYEEREKVADAILKSCKEHIEMAEGHHRGMN